VVTQVVPVQIRPSVPLFRAKMFKEVQKTRKSQDLAGFLLSGETGIVRVKNKKAIVKL
jgi:hypothetical protein